MTPLRRRIHRNKENILLSPQSINVNLLSCFENVDNMEQILNHKSTNNSNKFYTCDDKQLESDHFKIATEERKGILTNTETPKCSKIRQRQEFLADSPLIKNNINKFPCYGLNTDPCSKNKDANNISFSPNTFKNLFSSTPIVQRPKNLLEDIGDSSFDGVKDDNVNVVSPKTPKIDKNVNLNNSYTLEKIEPKDANMKKLKLYNLNLSGKIRPPSTSLPDQSVTPSYKAFIECLQKTCKIAGNWFVRIWVICLDFATNLKKDRAQVNKDAANHEMRSQSEQYEEIIAKLSKRVEELKKQVEDQTERNKQFEEQMKQMMEFNKEQLEQKIKMLNFQLNQSLQSEIKLLREQEKATRATTSFVSCSLPPPPPPLPPPPPPPPFPILPILKQKNSSTLQKKMSNANQNLRPAISLDDILKVKLKKTSARPYKPIPNSLRNNSPTVSLDMLRRVNLKPVSDISDLQKTSENQNDSLDATLSPNTRFYTLLKNEISNTRMKRLRRVGGYSHDSLFKRKLLDSRDRKYN